MTGRLTRARTVDAIQVQPCEASDLPDREPPSDAAPNAAPRASPIASHAPRLSVAAPMTIPKVMPGPDPGALIKTDGSIEVLQILAPVDPATTTTVFPDLARSAVEAVGVWRYEPTLLHGVPVDTRITISTSRSVRRAGIRRRASG